MYIDKELLHCIKMFVEANREDKFPDRTVEKATISDCLAVARFIFWRIEEDKREQAEHAARARPNV